MSSAAPPPVSPPANDEPRSALLPWHLQIAALIAVLGAIGLLIFSLVQPSRVETRPSQFFVCAGLGVCLAVLFFVFWPDKFVMDKVPYINVPVRVTGPVVLWIVVFLLLWALVPRADRYGGLFHPDGNKEPIFFSTEDTLKRVDGKEYEYRLIPDKEQRLLEAVYVEFDKGEDTFEAVFKHHNRREVRVKFVRGQSNFDMSEFGKE